MVIASSLPARAYAGKPGSGTRRIDALERAAYRRRAGRVADCSLEKLLRGNRIVAWGMALVMLAALAACDRDADQASQRDRGASANAGATAT